MWLKSKTDNQFIIVDREFLLEAINYIDKHKTCYLNDFFGCDFKKWNELEAVKRML
jgi:hypothetical protein